MSLEQTPADQVEHAIDAMITMLQSQGRGGNIVKDGYDQLSPPEAAKWTGAEHQLALLRSGREVWLEGRDFLAGDKFFPNLVVPYRQFHERKEFAAAVVEFVRKESP